MVSQHQHLKKLSRANSSLLNYSSVNTTTQTNERVFVERQLKRRDSQQKVTLHLRQLGKQSVKEAFIKPNHHSASMGNLHHPRPRNSSLASAGLNN